MKKLNNKGMTIIEILVCFVIVAIISASIYSSVTNYNNKKDVESYKQDIYKYKNLITKEINDDIVFKGLVNVSNYGGDLLFAGNPREILGTTACPSGKNYYNPNNYSCDDGSATEKLKITDSHGGVRVAIIQFTFRDKTQKILQVITLRNNPSGTSYGDYSDCYLIAYGSGSNTIKYPLPNLGSKEIDAAHHVVYDLTMEIKDLRLTSANVFYLDIRFHHPDLDDKYGIKINAPLNMDYFDRQ